MSQRFAAGVIPSRTASSCCLLNCCNTLPHLFLSVSLPRDAMHKRGYSRHAVSVCLSVTFVDHVKTNKHIFEMFSPSGSHTILVCPCPYQTGWRMERGTPLTGASNACAWGREKRDSGRIYGFIAYRSTVLSTVRVAKCEEQSRDEQRH